MARSGDGAAGAAPSPTLRQRLADPRPLLLDAAMGTALLERGLDLSQARAAAAGAPRDAISWSLTHAREVLSIHRAHVEAGAELLLANTFGARPPTRAELTAALSLARKAGARYAAVALWTGLPTAELAETARAAAGAGADALWLETAMHADQACRALEAALGAGELPVAITLAFSAFPAGDAPADVYGPPLAQLASQGASVVGLNCGPWDAHGASGRTTELAVLVRALSSALPVPLALKPDAGARTPGAWAAAVADAARSGAALVGGCCGTGAPHLRALRDELANRANPRG